MQRLQALILSCMLFIAGTASQAQTSIPRNIPSVLPAPLVLPPTSASDPAATDALARAIEASGGRAAWRLIHSAQLRIKVTTAGSAQSRNVLMLDDWTSNVVLYRRGTIGANKAPMDHSGQANLVVTSRDGKTRQLPEFDQARVLAGSLPSAAAHIILRNPSYLVKQDADPKCGSQTICIDVYRQPAANAPFIREEEWTISASTSLPLTIVLFLPNLIGHRPVLESFHFDQMMTQNGLTIPATVELTSPGGGIQVRTLVSFSPNVPFDKAVFDKELSQ